MDQFVASARLHHDEEQGDANSASQFLEPVEDLTALSLQDKTT